MKNFFDNLVYTVTNAGVTTGINAGFRFVNKLIDGEDKQCKFYYDKEGGGIWNIMLRSIIGSGVAYAQKEALEQLNKLFFGGKQQGFSVNNNSLQTRLIEEANECDASDSRYIARKYGVMKVNKGKNVVVAVDFCGNWCPDAVMLGIPVKDGIPVIQENIASDQEAWKRTNKMTNSFTSDTLVWYDPTALITVQNSKNYILTRVNGRDSSRKELISNGDIEFSITGRINSNLPDVYPTQEIKKFIQIMQYKGLVKINSQIIDQYHIDKVFIKDYSLPQKEGYRNIQEYTINCVGSMQTEEVRVDMDTIIAIDNVIEEAQEKTKNKWQKMLSDTVEGLKASTISTTANATTTFGGKLDNLLKESL